MKFLAVLTMLAVSGLASAQVGAGSSSAAGTTVSPSAAPTSGTATMQDSPGTMNTDPKLIKGSDQQRMEEREMDDRGLDSAESMDSTNTTTSPSTSPVTP